MLGYETYRLSKHITQITDAAGVSMFLVVGDEKALLIDTGTGLKGLDEVIRNITDKQLTVILTHGHGDHSGGASIFNDVYIPFVDRKLAIQHGKNMRVDYIRTMLDVFAQSGANHKEFCPDEDIVPPVIESTKFHDLVDGMVFSLGGISAEIIAVPGHTKGCCMVLFPEERSILFGDACNPNTLVGGEESTTISEYKKSLERLKKWESKYDIAYFSHGQVRGSVSCLEDNIELCDRILSGTDDHVPEMGISGPGFMAARKVDYITRADGKVGNIFYSERTSR